MPRSRTGLLLSGAALVVLLAVLAAAAMLVSRSFDSGSGVPGATAVSAPAPSAAASAPEPLGAAETPKSENSDDGRSTAGTVSMVGPCAYTEDTATGPVVAPPPASATLPPAPSTMVISTSAGDLVVNLSGAAPCAVHALRHLADAGYFDGSACPREFLGDSQDPPVLQCGDPTGSGSGAPGFSYPAETTSAYPFGAGVVAVAHLPGQRPARAGAQFVIGLAEPSSAALARAGAQYTVIGQLDTDSRAVLDLLAGPGIVGNGTDGPPASGATIQKVTFAG